MRKWYLRLLLAGFAALTLVVLGSTAVRNNNKILSTVTPSSGASAGGINHTFVFSVGDTGGSGKVKEFNVLFFNPVAPTTSDEQHACWMSYKPAENTIWVSGRKGWISAPIGRGGSSGPLLEGNECLVDVRTVTATNTKQALTLTMSVTFTINLGGWADKTPVTMPVYMRGTIEDGVDSGYEAKGTWTVNPGVNNSPNFALSITGAQQGKSPKQFVSPGNKARFKITVNALNGFTDTVLFTATRVSTPAEIASPVFDPPSVTGSGSTIMTIATGNSAPPGLYAFNVTAFVSSSGIHHEDVAHIGVSSGPPELSVTPSQGSDSRRTFTFTATDLSTADGVTGVSFLITSAMDGKTACRMHFERDTGFLWLASDDGASWSQIMVGSKETLRNHQCTVGGLGSEFQATVSGNNLILKVPILFTPSFAGPKKIYMRSMNIAGFDTGFQEIGTWEVPRT